MGSKGSNQTTQTQNQTQTYSADPYVKQTGYQALGMASNAANQPFQMPVAPVAGFSPLQQQAFNQYQALQGTAQPYYNTAQGLYQQSAAPITGADVSNYYNPMAGNVTAQLQNIFGQQNQQNTADLIRSAGGIGADRIAVGQANMANQQGLAAGQTYANLYQQALQAAQSQKGMEAGAASGMAGLGTAAQNAALQGTGALLSAGGLQQQQSQAELNAPYQNTLARLAYPFQTAQYLAGITGGLAPALGGTTFGSGTQVTTPPTPSLANQLLGIGTAGLGIWGSLGAPGLSMDTYGGGNPFSGDAFGGTSANPLPGLSPSDYGVGYADGGAVDDQPIDVTKDKLIPAIPFTGGDPQSHFHQMQFSQPQQQSQTGGSDIGSTIGKAVSTALPFIMAMKNGGSAYPKFGDDDPGGPVPIMGAGPPSDEARTIGLQMLREQMAPYRMPSQQAVQDWRNSTPLPGGAAATKDEDEGDSGAAPSPPSVGGYTMPKEQLPYPDALNRDWGQTATRSPWMALVEAGATMAATPGPLGQAIGKGLQAGVQSLDKQRGELRSEQQLNDKAKELYMKAQDHLDKYNKMTPYERASVAARNRELDQEEAGVTGKPGKFTGADYDRAAKFVASLNPGITDPAQLQPLIDAEVARRRASLARGTSAASAVGGVSAQTALPDPGEGKRTKGVWYIGPSGQPQQWLGE